MTEKEILTKAVEKALKNGMPSSVIDKGTFYQLYITVGGKKGHILLREFIPEDCYGLIFNHEFAKAFWNIKISSNLIYTESGNVYKKQKFCEYHLQQMVLEKNPIQYLELYL